MWGTQVSSLGQEDPLEKGMATHSNIHAWRIPWTEDPGRVQSMPSQRVGNDGATNTHFSFMCVCMRACVQLCLTLYNPVDYKPPGSSVHRILQAKILEWVAMPSSKGFSHIYIKSFVSCCLLSNLNQKNILILCPFLA